MSLTLMLMLQGPPITVEMLNLFASTPSCHLLASVLTTLIMLGFLELGLMFLVLGPIFIALGLLRPVFLAFGLMFLVLGPMFLRLELMIGTWAT